MTVMWSVEVLISGRENVRLVECGAVGTDHAARAAATGALMAGAQKWGRQEFWVALDGLVIMVVPGLDDDGTVDAAGLRDALGLLPIAGRT